jgi:Zn-dependent M28 family amino/carboxypeptidase
VVLAGPLSPTPVSRATGPLDDFVIAPEVLANDPAEFRQFRPDIYYPELLDPDPTIQGMMDQVISDTVVLYDGGLSGEWPVTIGGSPYTIVTRHTTSGEPIQKATQYAGEHLSNLGLSVEYHIWNATRPPNVIGQLTGETVPEDIYIITAHIDDMPSGGVAPGADDNASGSTAVMIAADILTQYRWDCTLRFIFFTGEEQGLLGSSAYAQRSYYAGENILGVLNLDMIAWNTRTLTCTPNQPFPPRLHWHNSLPM